ncbi:phage tail sheath family protein [Streptomyces sp. ISL-36]|uniref:phage tail sheath family protein n=1 Tax=Streptomyces sp. ISL-36 TaxID=2819182 RepID=UPI001BE6A79F|nr:phage tail sheath C-terminal domain-containing protein [Streptomyces sp. ISL-36]MBT2442713.1 phage tail sheath family protein [Streptomyces sp. ISL-36]
MAVAPTYPGVYIEELESATRTIVAVPSSIAAFVGYTARGPENVATRIFTFADFERLFGGLDRESELSYAVRQFFLNGGTDAYVVRVPKTDGDAAGITLRSATDNTGRPALVITALSKGSWGNNLVVDVDHDGVPAQDTKTFNLTISDLATGTTERFAGVSMDSTSSSYVETVTSDPDNGSRTVSVKIAPSAVTRPAAGGTPGGDINFAALKNDKDYSLKATSDLPNGRITQVPVTVIAANEPLPTSVAGLCALLERKINAALAARVAGARVRCVPSSSGKGIRVISDFDPVALPDAVDAVITFAEGDPDSLLPTLNLDSAKANVGRYRLGVGRAVQAQQSAVEGEDGTHLPGDAALIGSAHAFTGMHALGRVDLFTILCIPDATRPSAGNPNALDSTISNPNAVFTEAMQLCAKHRAMLIVDPPPAVRTVDKALDWISSGLTAKGPDATAYFPRLRVPDPLNGFRLRTVAPSGTLAGLWARTDAARGAWKAPGGTEARLLGVGGLDCPLTDAENGVLNPLGLNCLRTLPVYGTVSWGARTLDGADVMASEWKYLPVRRLAKVIEESAFRGTQWAVFEPNDEALWSQLRLNLTSFMHGLFRQGAFQGTTPRDAYLVKCDAQTTTQYDIDRGVVNVLLGFAPLKPAEFVFIRLQQLTGQTQG